MILCLSARSVLGSGGAPSALSSADVFCATLILRFKCRGGGVRYAGYGCTLACFPGCDSGAMKPMLVLARTKHLHLEISNLVRDTRSSRCDCHSLLIILLRQLLFLGETHSTVLLLLTRRFSRLPLPLYLLPTNVETC